MDPDHDRYAWHRPSGKSVDRIPVGLYPLRDQFLYGIKATKNVHIWVAQTFGASHLQILFKVALPTALPYIFTGLKVSLNSAWASLVAAEMLGSASGLGYMIQMGRLLSRADLIVAGMVVIGIIGTILSAVLDLLERIMVKGEVR